jgi:hypothetical protein
MGYQPKIKSPKGAIHEYKTFSRKKDRNTCKHISRKIVEEKQTASEREVSEVILKRLHTLGIQKFGSSPFSDHFDRWLPTLMLFL